VSALTRRSVPLLWKMSDFHKVRWATIGTNNRQRGSGKPILGSERTRFMGLMCWEGAENRNEKTHRPGAHGDNTRVLVKPDSCEQRKSRVKNPEKTGFKANLKREPAREKDRPPGASGPNRGWSDEKKHFSNTDRRASGKGQTGCETVDQGTNDNNKRNAQKTGKVGPPRRVCPG